jgi:N-acetylneuraminic acid mutarotase
MKQRFFCMLLALAFATIASAQVVANPFASLPQATSSFGAAVSDGWLYVYGGHIATTHSYSTEAVSGQFARLKLSAGAKWEQLPAGPRLQGMNLAVHDGKIYRIGGMTPRNKPGEPDALFSVPDCARFNPASMKWETLPPLPEPRSSHDVVVIGDKLIVVGGFKLKGSEPMEWMDSLAVLDLAADKLEWKSAMQPFRRRALGATAFSGKMYVLGGLDDASKLVREVAIYNPASGAWTKGPEFPGDGVDGFSPAATVHHADLYVSVSGGTLYRLNEVEGKWEKAGASKPRIAHRIVSTDHAILVIGGESGRVNSSLIEAIPVTTQP